MSDEERLAYHIGTRKGITRPPAIPCPKCGKYGNHVERNGGRAAEAPKRLVDPGSHKGVFRKRLERCFVLDPPRFRRRPDEAIWTPEKRLQVMLKRLLRSDRGRSYRRDDLRDELQDAERHYVRLYVERRWRG